MMDLRDVVHGRHAVIELAEPAEQLVDVHVLRPVDGSERQQDEFIVGDAAARRVRLIVDQDPVGEKAAQRRLELMVVRVDEARHDDPAAGIDDRGGAGAQIRPDRDDLLALDQHVGLRKITDARVQRHHSPAANEQPPAVPSAVFRRVVFVGRRRARREQIGCRGGRPGDGRRLQEVAP
jgi:hypothetical protein